MKQETTWRGEYRRLIDQLVGQNPLIGRASIAERMAVSEDDLEWFLDHPLARLPLTKRGPDALSLNLRNFLP
jgi:hypothetical protein